MNKFVERVKIENHVFSGGIWFIGWLFTIGYAGLSFWEGVLGLVIWPYYLGSHIIAQLTASGQL